MVTLVHVRCEAIEEGLGGKKWGTIQHSDSLSQRFASGERVQRDDID